MLTNIMQHKQTRQEDQVTYLFRKETARSLKAKRTESVNENKKKAIKPEESKFEFIKIECTIQNFMLKGSPI